MFHCNKCTKTFSLNKQKKNQIIRKNRNWNTFRNIIYIYIINWYFMSIVLLLDLYDF